jgi:hypothetical protein
MTKSLRRAATPENKQPGPAEGLPTGTFGYSLSRGGGAMIVDIPPPEELARSSIDLLNMAWDSACAIIAGLENSEVKEWDDDGSAQRDYHAASQRSLANALAIIQQAQELGLKSRIAAVSPYLLIAGDPRGWPKNSAGDLSFSEFRTIDASDLIRVHNIVCSTGVDDRFVQVFEDTRRRRNLFVHLGRHKQSQDAKAILILILRTMKALFPDRRWPSELYDFARRDRYTTIGGEDYVEMGLVNQFEMLRRILILISAPDATFANIVRPKSVTCPERRYRSLSFDQIGLKRRHCTVAPAMVPSLGW